MSLASSPKQAIATFMSTLAILWLCLFCALYVYDPLQIFHKPWLRQDGLLHENFRLQAAGVINNYEFDSLIIGTSLLENTSAKHASETLGGNFVNLSIAGGNYLERSLLLNYALQKKTIAQVVYSLDYSFINLTTTHPRYESSMFDFLYDESRLNDITAYFNDRFLRCLLVLSQSRECVGRKKTLDRPNAWFNKPRHQARYGGLDQWLNTGNDLQLQRMQREIKNTAERAAEGLITTDPNLTQRITAASDYIDQYLISHARQDPDTRFILVFPPHFRVRYAMWAQADRDKAAIYMAMVRSLAKLSDAMPNVEVYGWDTRAFVDDISKYKDTSHFHVSINRWMIDAVARRKGLLTARNVTAYLNAFEEKALAFDLVGLGRAIDVHLSSQPKSLP